MRSEILTFLPPSRLSFILTSKVSGAALESAIANMEEMGFAKPEIQRAMRASFNNPDRAIEYLMTVSLSWSPLSKRESL